MLTFACPSCQTKLQAAESTPARPSSARTCQAKAIVPTPAADARRGCSRRAVAAEPASTGMTTPDNASASKSSRKRPRQRWMMTAMTIARAGARFLVRHQPAPPSLGHGRRHDRADRFSRPLACSPAASSRRSRLPWSFPPCQKVRRGGRGTQSVNNLKHLPWACRASMTPTNICL